jgi:hypothetical protein
MKNTKPLLVQGLLPNQVIDQNTFLTISVGLLS